MDLTTIQAAAQAIGGASKLAKALVNVRDGAVFAEKANELYGVILAAQSDALEAQSAALAAKGELDRLAKRVAELEDFEREKARYELKDPRENPREPGVFAYLLKPEMAAGEPRHCLCATCYQRSIKSILQAKHVVAGRAEMLVCHTCRAEIVVKGVVDERDRPQFART